MTIPAEFTAKYANEDQFVDQFLIPLLRRMGFSVVVNYHGKQEFGKDLIFAEISQFGHVVYHGLQAKYVDSIGQSESHGLVDDCKEAFANPFMHPHTGAEERICTFYTVNGGSIADNARTNFFNSLQTPHGGHVRLLDGKALLALDRIATMGHVENVGQLLTGLLLEGGYNAKVLGAIMIRLRAKAADRDKPMPAERLRSLALANYLLRPLSVPDLPEDLVLQTWHLCELANRWLDFGTSSLNAENRDELVRAALGLESQITANLTQLLIRCRALLQSLEPLAAI